MFWRDNTSIYLRSKLKILHFKFEHNLWLLEIQNVRYALGLMKWNWIIQLISLKKKYELTCSLYFGNDYWNIHRYFFKSHGITDNYSTYNKETKQRVKLTTSYLFTNQPWLTIAYQINGMMLFIMIFALKVVINRDICLSAVFFWLHVWFIIRYRIDTI